MHNKSQGLKKVIEEQPHRAGNAAMEISQKSFAQGQIADKVEVGKWKPPKKKGSGTRCNRRAQLIKSIELQKSIDYQAQTGQVTIGRDKQYAQVHNQGGHAGRGAGFSMPKRQFMGNSPENDDQMDRLFN